MGTFDGLDTTPAIIERPTSEQLYTPCIQIDQDGRSRKVSVARIRLMTHDTAVAALKAGKVAWVAETDAESVIATWRGHDDR